jgi:hypothetical protein
MLGQKGEIRLPRETMEKFLQECGPALRMLIERQPVLWRYNTSGVLLEMCELYDEDEYTYPQNRCMSVNSMSAPGFNFDFDGDSMPCISISTKQGKEEFPAIFIKNQIEYDHHRGLIASPEHESIYAAYMLSLFGDNIDFSAEIVEIDDDMNLNDIEVSIDDVMENYNVPVKFRGQVYSYNHILINIALNQNKIIYTKERFGLLKKGNLKKLIQAIELKKRRL